MAGAGVTVESDVPWIPGAVIAYLLTDAPFTTSCGGRVKTKGDKTIMQPYVTVRLVTPMQGLSGGGYKPLIQVDAWSPDLPGIDPERVVWVIASRAARALQAARNVSYETAHWSSGEVDLGQLPPDVTRGESNPLYRAVVRATLTVHNR